MTEANNTATNMITSMESKWVWIPDPGSTDPTQNTPQEIDKTLM